MENEKASKNPKTDQLRAMRERAYEARKQRNPAELPDDEDKALARGRAKILAAQRALNRVTGRS